MFPTTHSLICSFIFVLICLNFSNAKRNYKLLLTDIKCKSNRDYVEKFNCTFDKSTSDHNLEFQMMKEVKHVRFDFWVYAKRPDSNNKYILFKAENVEGCDFVSGKTSLQPVLQMFKKVLQDSKNLVPDYCAVTSTDHMKLTNIILDPEFLPVTVPEVEFVVDIVGKDFKTMFFTGELFGKVSPNKRSNKAG